MVLISAAENDIFIDAFLKDSGLYQDQEIIGFQVGAANRYKMWPQRCFVQLGRKLAQYAPATRIVLTGSKNEMGLCQAIARDIGPTAISAAGRIFLGQLPAMVKRMRGLVTNDTGTMHMAIALKTSTVSLFCPTESKGIGPYQDMHLHRIIQKERPCNPCNTKKCKKPFCMELITVDEVFGSLENLLQ